MEYNIGKTVQLPNGGPATEWSDGFTIWWINGKEHREDGPAVEYPNGTKRWYLNGIEQFPNEASNNS